MREAHCAVCTQLIYDPLRVELEEKGGLIDQYARDITAKILPIIKKVLPDSFTNKQIIAFQLLFDSPDIFDEIAAMIAMQLMPTEKDVICKK